jgi:hypothetical protein
MAIRWGTPEAGASWVARQQFTVAAQIRRKTGAFSSEVGTGSREENASNKEVKPSVPIQSERKRLYSEMALR